ncbi:hypothetical protein ACFL47_10610, partial [Candidatus Latescibacterota bacterium]
MLNLIGFLIVVIITMFRMESGYASNPLLNSGTLILCGYLLSLFMTQCRLPAVFGYIIAGILFAGNGLGFVDVQFTGQVFFFENICIMMILAESVRIMTANQKLGNFLRYFITGVLSTIITMVAITFMPWSATIPIGLKAGVGLLASMFSPLAVYSLVKKDHSASMLQIAFGGFITSLLLWGAATGYLSPEKSEGFRRALMPFIIGLSSITAGFVWALFAEKTIYDASPRLSSTYPLALMILLYPLIQPLGLDFMFLATGIGLYNGIISTREFAKTSQFYLPFLIVFVLFGTKLSIEEIFIARSMWLSTLGVGVLILFVRAMAIMLTARLLLASPVRFDNIVSFLMYGPLSFIILQRFLPAFRSLPGGDDGFNVLYMFSIM